ncbi:MAG: T9SS type A sorting domain-containing protein [Sphingobacteriales bacterium]|nr:T9SS type A sorting domain-containing protein [Sphingobacteriales bacterium]
MPNEPNNLTANAPTVICSLINNTSNPNTLQIQYNAPQTQPTTLQIYNIMGRLLTTQTFDATKGINTWQMPVGMYPAGVYLLQVSNTNSKETVKWIKE